MIGNLRQMTSALILENLKKTYDNGVKAVKSVNLTIPEGEFFGLLGPNGAGKSTTIGMVSSLVNKTSGKISIFGVDLDANPGLAKTKIGLVPQEFNFNVFEQVIKVLIFQAGYYGIPPKVAAERAEHYLKRLGLWEKATHQVRSLSGGLKRRLLIARGLMHEPKLLILDEPTAGVDIELRRGIWTFLEEINKKGTTIILTTHYLEEAERLCRQVAIIDEGEIIANTTVRDLISRLDKEAYILDLKYPLESVPSIEGVSFIKKEPQVLEVIFDKHFTINRLFARLTELGIEINSMRNKSNRLEELYMMLVGHEAGSMELNGHD